MATSVDGTGGIGFDLEDWVGVWGIGCMAANVPLICLEEVSPAALPRLVAFQNAHRGVRTDDVLVSTDEGNLWIECKQTLEFVASDLPFIEAISKFSDDIQGQMREPSPIAAIDLFVLAYGQTPRTENANRLAYLLRTAKAFRSAESWFSRVQSEKRLQTALEHVLGALRLRGNGGIEHAHKLCSRLILWHVDLMQPFSRDRPLLLSLLKTVGRSSGGEIASLTLEHIYAIAHRLRVTGGEIDDRHVQSLQRTVVGLDLPVDSTPQALYRRALLAIDMDSGREAIRLLRTAMKLAPNDPFLHYSLADLYGSTGRYNLALGHYKTAVRLFPEFPDAIHKLGYTYEKLGRWKEAVKEYMRVLELDPDSVESELNVALAIARTGNLKDARTRLRRIVRKNPRYANAVYNLARLEERLGNSLEAVRLYRRAVRLDPRKVEALNNLGRLLLIHAGAESALPYLEQAHGMSPEDVPSIENLANAVLASNNPDRALDLVIKGLTLDGSNPELHHIKGRIHHVRCELEDAYREYAFAIDLDPAHSAAHYNAAVIAMLLNDGNGFVQHLQAAIRTEPANRIAALEDPRFEDIREHELFIEALA